MDGWMSAVSAVSATCCWASGVASLAFGQNCRLAVAIHNHHVLDDDDDDADVAEDSGPELSANMCADLVCVLPIKL